MGSLSSILGGSASLASKYAVGEIVDFAGVPSFYDAGDSKWMQGNTWFAASSLPVAVKDRLGANYNLASLVSNDVLVGVNRAIGAYGGAAKVGDVAVYPSAGNGSNVFMVDGSGPRWVNTGMTNSPSDVSVYATATEFFAFGHVGTLASARARKSSNGASWSAIAGFSAPTLNLCTYSYDIQHNNSPNGQGRTPAFVSNNNGAGGVFWCGARHLAVGHDGSSYFRAALSSDAATWNDATATMVGGATVPFNNYFHFNRNGNNCFFSYTGYSKYSADGGATWNAATGCPDLMSQHYLQKNQTDAAKMILAYSGSDFCVSTNNGQTWTDRFAGLSAITATWNSVAYKGSTIIVGLDGGNFARSTDDGATWSQVILPAGTLGSARFVTADDTNFYLTTSAGQILVSADGVTLTIRAGVAGDANTQAIRVDANTIALVGSGIVQYTLDGGVTWKGRMIKQASGLPTIGSKVTVGANTYLAFSNQSYSSMSGAFCPLSDLSAGGAYFRATTSALNPIRTGATAMIRVA